MHIVTQVIREPDERIVLKSQPPPPVDSSESRKPSLSHQGDASLHTETSVTTSQLSRPPSPLNQPLLQERSAVSIYSLARRVSGSVRKKA